MIPNQIINIAIERGYNITVDFIIKNFNVSEEAAIKKLETLNKNYEYNYKKDDESLNILFSEFVDMIAPNKFAEIDYFDEEYKLFFQKIKELFKKVELHVLAVSINIDDFEQLYGNEETNQIYYISLQLLMENYNHFLISNNACGSVYLESTDSGSNTTLQNLFHQLKATGTLFYSKESLQKHLTTINFIPKSDNNLGVQFADFIPNPLAREALHIQQKEYTLLPIIKKCLYDGKLSMESRFGFKIVH